MEIFPSLISSDLLNLEKTIKFFDPICDGYHIDVMDNHFVPNLTWGPKFVNAIRNVTVLPLHVHLMVDDPANWVDRLQLREKDCFIFHIESLEEVSQIKNLIQDIKNRNWLSGLAINPKTSTTLVFDYLSALDHVLIMSVEPGFSGQKYMPEVENKIELLLSKREELNLNFKIGMDGGIGVKNIKRLSTIGVDQFGIASAIFSADDPIKALQNLYK